MGLIGAVPGTVVALRPELCPGGCVIGHRCVVVEVGAKARVAIPRDQDRGAGCAHPESGRLVLAVARPVISLHPDLRTRVDVIGDRRVIQVAVAASAAPAGPGDECAEPVRTHPQSMGVVVAACGAVVATNPKLPTTCRRVGDCGVVVVVCRADAGPGHDHGGSIGGDTYGRGVIEAVDVGWAVIAACPELVPGEGAVGHGGVIRVSAGIVLAAVTGHEHGRPVGAHAQSKGRVLQPRGPIVATHPQLRPGGGVVGHGDIVL